MVVLTCTISDSIKKPDKLDMFVQAVEQIHSEFQSQLQDFSDPCVYAFIVICMSIAKHSSILAKSSK